MSVSTLWGSPDLLSGWLEILKLLFSFAILALVGKAIAMILSKINTYTSVSPLPEDRPALPIEKWWSGLIFAVQWVSRAITIASLVLILAIGGSMIVITLKGILQDSKMMQVYFGIDSFGFPHGIGLLGCLAFYLGAYFWGMLQVDTGDIKWISPLLRRMDAIGILLLALVSIFLTVFSLATISQSGWYFCALFGITSAALGIMFFFRLFRLDEVE
jgi:hypothetical protein